MLLGVCRESPDRKHVLLVVADDGRCVETHCQACGAVLFTWRGHGPGSALPYL